MLTPSRAQEAKIWVLVAEVQITIFDVLFWDYKDILTGQGITAALVGIGQAQTNSDGVICVASHVYFAADFANLPEELFEGDIVACDEDPSVFDGR